MKKVVKSQKFFLLFVAGIMFSALSFAQPGRGYNESPRDGRGYGERRMPPPAPDSAEVVKMVKHLSIELELTKAQEKEITQLFTEHFNEVRELTRPGNSRQEMAEKRDAFRNSVSEQLSGEQAEKFEEFMNDNRRRGQAPPRRRRN